MKDKILVVEDNPFERNLIVQALNGPGLAYEVQVAESAEAALETLRKEPPAVVLMDCRLPGMNGIEALRAIRKLGLSMPVVMCTAEDAKEIVLDALRSGASDFLVKDRTYHQLIPHAVDKALGVYRLERERVAILERLKQSKDRYERLVINAHDIMFQADSSGRFLYFNAAVHSQLGHAPEEFYSDPQLPCRLIHPEDREKVRETWRRILEKGGEASLEARIVAGGLRTLQYQIDIHTVPLPGGSGHVTQGIARDVTESRELAQQLGKEKLQLEEANRKLQEVNRLKNEFVASVSHELRTPMNSIIGYTDCLLDGLDGPLAPEQHQSLMRVKNNATQLLNLLNDILDLAKIEAGKMRVQPEDFDLPEVCRDVLNVIRPLVRNDTVELLADLPATLPVRADYDKVRRVLMNLLSNAVKFTRNGHVKLTVARHPAIAGSLKIQVEDTGIGIREEDLPVIFDDFRQANGSSSREFGGTGLGLSITKRLVGLHGGEIWVKSEFGTGTVFHVVLPVLRQDQAAHEPSEGAPLPADEAVASSGDPGRPIVLVVDPEQDTVTLFKKSLVPAGYRVVGTTEGNDALRMIRELKPCALFLDPSVAKANGLPVAKTLKADPELRSLPVVLLVDENDPALVMRLGAVDCVVRPVELREVQRKMAAIAAGRRQPSVLVVDDEADIREVLEDILRIGGYTDIRTARNGAEAMAELKRRLPDLMLTGLTMPVMDGFEAIEQIRKTAEYRDLPIIVVSGRILTSREQAFLEQHVRKVVSKTALERRMLGAGLDGLLGGEGDEA